MNKQPIVGYIQHWLDTVCKHNANDIVNLYAPDGVLLGTVAKTIKNGHGELMQYFNMFVTKQPCGEIDSYYVQDYGDIAIVDGTYTFELNNDYEGGDLVWELNGKEFHRSKTKPNSLVIWPSNFLYPHKVEPVTKGLRWSMVAWAR